MKSSILNSSDANAKSSKRSIFTSYEYSLRTNERADEHNTKYSMQNDKDSVKSVVVE